MAEQGRVPPPMRLCRACRHFVYFDDIECHFCGCDLDAVDADYARRQAALDDAARELREALAQRRVAPR